MSVNIVTASREEVTVIANQSEVTVSTDVLLPSLGDYEKVLADAVSEIHAVSDAATQSASTASQAAESAVSAADSATAAQTQAASSATEASSAAATANTHATAAQSAAEEADTSQKTAVSAATTAASAASTAVNAVNNFGLSAGQTTTSAAGTNAQVTVTKNGTKYVADFTIPRGEKGEKGVQGDAFTTNVFRTPTDSSMMEGVTVKAGDIWLRVQPYVTWWTGDENASTSVLADYYETTGEDSSVTQHPVKNRILETLMFNGADWDSLTFVTPASREES